MSMQKLSILSVGLLFCTACETTHASKLGAPVLVQTKRVIATPDVVAGEKITGFAHKTKLFGIITLSGPSRYADGVTYNVGGGDQMKNAAAYDACVRGGADVILSPNYVVEEKNYFFVKKTIVTVDGFKGQIKGISKIEYGDPIIDAE